MEVSENQALAIESNVSPTQDVQVILPTQPLNPGEVDVWTGVSDLIKSIKQYCKTHDVHGAILLMKPKAEGEVQSSTRKKPDGVGRNQQMMEEDKRIKYKLADGVSLTNRHGNFMKILDTIQKSPEGVCTREQLLAVFPDKRTWLLQEVRRAIKSNLVIQISE